MYVSDFSNERVGRFPSSQLGFDSGNGQIVELDGERVLEVSASTIFTVSLPETLPEDFSVEFDVQTATQNMGLDVFFGPKLQGYRDYESQYLQFGANPGIYHQGQALSSVHMGGGLSAQFYPVKRRLRRPLCRHRAGREPARSKVHWLGYDHVPHRCQHQLPRIHQELRGSRRH